MLFHETIDYENVDGLTIGVERVAVRAVIKRANQYLLLQTMHGDVKFPGGGVKNNEPFELALRREIAEETGYIKLTIANKIGEVVERKVDEFDPKSIFQMISHYYSCTLENEENLGVTLDDYEVKLEFKSTWLTLEEAILCNEDVLQKGMVNSWVERENLIFKRLLNVDKK